MFLFLQHTTSLKKAYSTAGLVIYSERLYQGGIKGLAMCLGVRRHNCTKNFDAEAITRMKEQTKVQQKNKMMMGGQVVSCHERCWILKFFCPVLAQCVNWKMCVRLCISRPVTNKATTIYHDCAGQQQCQWLAGLLTDWLHLVQSLFKSHQFHGYYWNFICVKYEYSIVGKRPRCLLKNRQIMVWFSRSQRDRQWCYWDIV